VGVPVEGGELQLVTERVWGGLAELAWLPDGSGLVMIAIEEEYSGWQLFEMRYPSGEVHRITNDLNSYQGLSLTADGKRLATVLGDRHSSIWVQPVDGSSPRRQIETTTGTADGADGVLWTTDGRIVYAADEGTEEHLWLMNSDGSDARRLTVEGVAQDEPGLHPDGERIVFTSFDEDRVSVWSIRLDGTGLEDLIPDATFGTGPAISPDGEWLFFTGILESDFKMVRRSFATGESEAVITGDSHSPSWSPDGNRMALHFQGEGDRLWKTGILTPDGSEILETHDFHSELESPWSTDGGSLFHAETIDGVMNLFLMPLDGGEPQPLTDFSEGEIFHFDVSPEGLTLLMAQGRRIRDIVLIDNFR